MAGTEELVTKKKVAEQMFRIKSSSNNVVKIAEDKIRNPQLKFITSTPGDALLLNRYLDMKRKEKK